jgi:2-keto-4-pentenoate hydratase/2-oxohepta-3-ene-1,7-dioic acid hydratase in catechol pathway
MHARKRGTLTREEFIFDVPELVEETTTYVTLDPGDVISTGTPAGVAPLDHGDEIEVEVEGVGVVRHHVREL